MANFNWDDYDQVKPRTQQSPDSAGGSDGFSWDDHPVVPEENPNKSPVTAATTGIIQSAVPFAAPIAGAGRAAMNAITGVSGPLAGGSLEDIVDDYRSGRDQFQKDARTAADANPKTAFAFNIAGGFANPLFHGADTLPKVVAASAIQGLGTSDTDLTKVKDDPNNLLQAAKDSGLAAAGGALGYGVGKAIPKVWDGVKYFGKKALTTLGPSEEAINARLAGGAQDSASNYSDLAEKLSDTVKTLKSQISEASNHANGLLSAEKDIPKPYIASGVDEAISQLGLSGKNGGSVLLGPTDKAASAALNGIKQDIENLPDQMSQKDLKAIIKKMDDNINWDDQSQDKLNTILEGLRTKFDQTLKFQNKAYEKAMEPVSDRMGLLTDVRRQFNLKNVPGEGLQPTDTTATKLQTSLRDNKAMTQDSLNKLNDYTGDNYLDKAKDYQLSQQFDVQKGERSARRAVQFGALGGALGTAIPGIGTVVGGGIGAVTGATLDKYGGQALGKLLDSYVKAGNSKVFGKFAPAIQKAAERGPEALAVTGSILGSNPEFKDLIKKIANQ